MVVRGANSLSQLSALGSGVRVGQPTSGSALLFLQNASHQLVNSSNLIQIVSRSCKWSAAGDLDNDMDLDVYLGCTGELSNLPNIVYENRLNEPSVQRFVAASLAAGGEGQMPEGRADSVMLGDYDQDGKLDVFLANGHLAAPFSYAGKVQVLRNTGAAGNHWIEIDLEGVTSNRDAIGAIVYATTPDGKVQMREQSNGVHNRGQDYKRVHFGLAANTRVDLEVRWPSGVVDNFAGLSADRIHRLVEGTGGNDAFTLSVSDPSVSESAGTAVFAVTLSPPPAAGQQVQVAYRTVDGTARAGSDYVALSGTLTFGQAETLKNVSVQVTDDTQSEQNETFSLELTGTQTNEVTAAATIRDNDGGVLPACGKPTYNKATETALFIWNDCGTTQWHMRATGGVGPTVSFRGSLIASPAFSTLTGFSIESSDRLPPSFLFNVGANAQDGADFSLPAGGQACFSLTPPGTVLAGSNRVPIAGSVSLPSFGLCP
jgi:hypothetical protein